MSSKHRIYDNGHAHFITCTIVSWVNLFTRPLYNDIVLESLEHCRHTKGLELYGYCLMSNHLHLIARAPDLAGCVRDFKKFTATKLYQAVESNSQESRQGWLKWMFTANGSRTAANAHIQVWGQGYHPIELSDFGRFEQRLNYVHQNPVRVGICFEAHQYRYSSAAQYAGLDAHPLLPVTLAW